MKSAADSTRHIPGEIGIWVFIAGDVSIFLLFFATYLFYRSQSVETYAHSALHLNQGLGLLNTMLMISSSWCVATAVNAARRAQPRIASTLIGAAMACGAGFVCVKYFEYAAVVRAGFTIDTNEFFTFYFGLTGIHLLHVLVGLGVLAFVRRGGLRGLESGASFWHMVDLLWIVLYALLYLVK